MAMKGLSAHPLVEGSSLHLLLGNALQPRTAASDCNQCLQFLFLQDLLYELFYPPLLEAMFSSHIKKSC
jgi:hypothetical protein